jgi:hypothetical protein
VGLRLPPGGCPVTRRTPPVEWVGPDGAEYRVEAETRPGRWRLLVSGPLGVEVIPWQAHADAHRMADATLLDAAVRGAQAHMAERGSARVSAAAARVVGGLRVGGGAP